VAGSPPSCPTQRARLTVHIGEGPPLHFGDWGARKSLICRRSEFPTRVLAQQTTASIGTGSGSERFRRASNPEPRRDDAQGAAIPVDLQMYTA
jgi:hypothetical protein